MKCLHLLVFLFSVQAYAQNVPTPIPPPELKPIPIISPKPIFGPLPLPKLPEPPVRTFRPILPPKDFVPPKEVEKPDKAPDSRPKEAIRLGIEKPTKSMRFSTEPSKTRPNETYDIVIDEEAAKETGINPEDIKSRMLKAMDSRQDAKEDNDIEINIEQPSKTPPETDKSSSTQTEPSRPIKKFMAKIKKSVEPKNKHAPGEAKEKSIPWSPELQIKIRSSGACPDQNLKTLDAFDLQVET